jgi:hypothetical protein
MPSSAPVAEKFSDNQWQLKFFCFFHHRRRLSYSAHTFRSIILLIRIYSDFIPENHSKPAFFGCE